MAIKVFADGANLEGMLDMHDNGNVQGFTTNPSLMKAGGVTDYRAFAKTVLEHITDVSVSFEVFADDEAGMEAEAREIATWADNVYVKIPALNTKGESTAALVKRLSADGIKVNVTTIFTPEQVDEFVDAVSAETPSILSIFAGRGSLGVYARGPQYLPGGVCWMPDHYGPQCHSCQAQEFRERFA